MSLLSYLLQKPNCTRVRIEIAHSEAGPAFQKGTGGGGVTSPQNTWKGGSQVIAGKREVQYQAGGREDKERRRMLSVELLD